MPVRLPKQRRSKLPHIGGSANLQSLFAVPAESERAEAVHMDALNTSAEDMAEACSGGGVLRHAVRIVEEASPASERRWLSCSSRWWQACVESGLSLNARTS